MLIDKETTSSYLLHQFGGHLSSTHLVLSGEMLRHPRLSQPWALSLAPATPGLEPLRARGACFLSSSTLPTSPCPLRTNLVSPHQTKQQPNGWCCHLYALTNAVPDFPSKLNAFRLVHFQQTLLICSINEFAVKAYFGSNLKQKDLNVTEALLPLLSPS